MNVPHTHMNHFLVSAFNSSESILCHKPLISFTEYLKSQIQYDIVSTLYGRDILEYNNAYNYLKGKDNSARAKSDYYKVVKYYYSDVAEMVLKSSEDFDDFSIIGNNEIPKLGDDVEILKVDIDSVARDIDNLLKGTGEVVNEFNLDYMEIVDGLTIRQVDNFNSKRLFTEVALLKYLANKPNLIYLEVI